MLKFSDRTISPSDGLVAPRALNFSSVSIDDFTFDPELIAVWDEFSFVVKLIGESELTYAVRHIVNKGTHVDLACLESERALAASLAILEFTFIDRSICIDLSAGSVRLAVNPGAVVCLAISHSHFALSATLTSLELSLVDILISADQLALTMGHTFVELSLV